MLVCCWPGVNRGLILGILQRPVEFDRSIFFMVSFGRRRVPPEVECTCILYCIPVLYTDTVSWHWEKFRPHSFSVGVFTVHMHPVLYTSIVLTEKVCFWIQYWYPVQVACQRYFSRIDHRSHSWRPEDGCGCLRMATMIKVNLDRTWEKSNLFDFSADLLQLSS